MPTWMSMDFIAANWQPLLVAIILGYIIGWLFTGIPNKRHANEAEDRAAGLDARLRKSERELTDVRREGESAKTRLASSQSDLDVARARIHELETPPVEESVAEVESLLAENDDALATDAGADDAMDSDREMEIGVLVDAGSDLDSDFEPTDADLAAAAALGVALLSSDDETMTMLIPAVSQEQLDSENEDAAAAFAAVARTPDMSNVPTNKDIALNEAYARVTALLGDIERTDAAMKAQNAELESVRAELNFANATRSELESRLVRAREDVASELAVLASTMIKMKDDALARADARIASLTAEADALRAQRSLPKPTIPAPAKPAPTPALTMTESAPPAPPVADAPTASSPDSSANGSPALDETVGALDGNDAAGAGTETGSDDGIASSNPAPTEAYSNE